MALLPFLLNLAPRSPPSCPRLLEGSAWLAFTHFAAVWKIFRYLKRILIGSSPAPWGRIATWPIGPSRRSPRVAVSCSGSASPMLPKSPNCLVGHGDPLSKFQIPTVEFCWWVSYRTSPIVPRETLSPSAYRALVSRETSYLSS